MTGPAAAPLPEKCAPGECEFAPDAFDEPTHGWCPPGRCLAAELRAAAPLQPTGGDALQRFVAERSAASPAFKAAHEDAHTRSHLLDVMIASRRRAGLTQADVAERMDITQPTISEFESESSDPHLSTLQRYARAIGGRVVVTFEPGGSDD